MKIHAVFGSQPPSLAAREAFRTVMVGVIASGTQLVTEPAHGPSLWAIELAVACGAQVHLWHGAGFRTLRVGEKSLRAEVEKGRKKYDPERVRVAMFAWIAEQASKHEVRVHDFGAGALPEGLGTTRWSWCVNAELYVPC